MRRFTHPLVLVAPFILCGLVGPVLGADRLILGRKLDIRDPTGLEPKRRITGMGKETSTDVPSSLSNPTTSGATLTIVANGGTGSNQSYVLDASGWKASGTGYNYRGPTGADGDPVKRVTLKRTASGVAMLKISLKGNSGTQSVDVLPPDPGDDGGYVLAVTGGDRYCVSFGAGAGGTEQVDTPLRWKLKNAQAQPGCPIPAVTTTTTTLPTISRCPGDPSRTIHDPSSECGDFETQADCEKAFYTADQCGSTSCFWDATSTFCRACEPGREFDGECVNRCIQPAPTCADSSKTIFAGYSESDGCYSLSFSPSLCQKAFQMTGDGGVPASCFFDVDNAECRVCDADALYDNACLNTCPVCDGDNTNTIFAGDGGGCDRFDSSPSSCDGAFVSSYDGVMTSCFYDNDSLDCNACEPNNQQNGECANTCPVCPEDDSREIFAGGPFSSPCRIFDNSPELCELAFHVGGQCQEVTSCFYDFNDGACRGCGPNNAKEGLCDNTCKVPYCGDFSINQPEEQCDGDNLGTCDTSCTPECQCAASPSPAFLELFE